ncbi:hypothetical protein M0R45_025766 [Rubus argutus]|uniref:Uncharacterized protein n=1 Tax=Rubus argutus TaxID=59490 RepID=A0AAW1WVP9_RUBAR
MTKISFVSKTLDMETCFLVGIGYPGLELGFNEEFFDEAEEEEDGLNGLVSVLMATLFLSLVPAFLLMPFLTPENPPLPKIFATSYSSASLRVSCPMIN